MGVPADPGVDTNESLAANDAKGLPPLAKPAPGANGFGVEADGVAMFEVQ